VTGNAVVAPPPVVVDFVAPTVLVREADRPSDLTIIGNGPPGTFVVFPNGLRVSLPTDQIVSAGDEGGFVRVGLGGMQFVGVQDGRLTFLRVLELWPASQLSPARSHRMELDPAWVSTVFACGERVWSAR
jgi:hypothetical protein